MRVLVAGDRGYIGAVLVPFLRGAGHRVDGLDAGLYEGCDFGAGPEDTGARPALDIRDAQAGQLAGYDAVICLAAPYRLHEDANRKRATPACFAARARRSVPSRLIEYVAAGLR